jgi:hypothetical protein
MYRPLLAEALWIQALVAVRQQQWGEARQALEEGILLAHSLPYPYFEARLLCVYGEMHARQGQPGQARAKLEEALAIFRHLGARKDTERVEQTLAALLAN